jgi:DNA-binding MarR family transcriptional regulator
MEKLVLDEYYRLWLLWSQTRNSIFKARQRLVGKYLHSNQAAALIAIWSFDGQATPAVLSRYLFLERHSVSELITRMEKKGLIRKSKDTKRRNVVRIAITDHGRKTCHNAMQPDFIRRIMSRLSSEQRDQLRNILNILLSEALKELDMEGKNVTIP